MQDTVLSHELNLLEIYCQTCTYDTGNNLTHLSHQANSSTWQQNLTVHPNNNRGTETQQSTTDFDANGNLLTLDNIGTLDWHYNNTLNQLSKADKNTTTQYYVYDYQGNRVRTVVESNYQVQSQRDYLPVLDISTNQAKQQANTLHVGTHILCESSKDNTQTRYQLTSHLQSNALELDDQAQTLSYEHYYPYGGTAIIAGKNKTEVQQKRYRYTGKERDDSSGLSYYGARYLAPWLARWISPDSAGAVDGLNLYAYVGNNPLKYVDPTGHVKTTSKQKNAEEGAVGGVESIPEKFRVDRDALSYSNQEINQIQTDIFQSSVFEKLVALDSSSRKYYLKEFDCQYYLMDQKIVQLRKSVKKSITDIENTGIPYTNALIQFRTSEEYKDLVFNKYKVANCSECSYVMLSELGKTYPDMTVEYLSFTGSDHVFNLINRDQSTSIFKPEAWNENSLVVDAWIGNVYTKKGFCIANTKLPYYGISKNITGITQHITKYAKSGVSYRTYKKRKITSEINMFEPILLAQPK
ncbi:hypothetical protein [uncultured Gammaproteobacteria bacterium]|uniref:RHS repeat-associated core domain-containing protein n=1 Tax=thiotrophic endosymbiont of Bathymodiolus puteoserpentis (Logatchev) TaxID=343240 RepID=UPI0010BAFEA4|nr:RHS repeat-associated core domain-containing protein [thiotrophic endosymbiont of Bathymodiolus puteoserpentis (Logatchev)]CAC9650512.1 hypothetical protein [uncultured Gammaproteobacteria bacterium]CAC9657577.1 hypothetical protein [uncultured Gammaproteobacteria bacterium]CAC9996251.1 hypothetical protein [uncultured Gammaproteobacteria bacterium]SSC09830.1 hypothetical protein BPUTEOSOX_685 [thiotrophic endosymbiont of Bathymodiolus puteoserpentis (Logatchev)]